jgi:hypothetical protein
MKKYFVKIPITGMARIEVEANDIEEAMVTALNDVCHDDVVKVEFHRRVLTGRTFNGVLSEMQIEEIKGV